MKLKCETCGEMKHDTAFQFKKGFFNSFNLDTSKCLDCKYPERWDKLREFIKKQFNL